MIHYMPFTYLSDERITSLTRMMGPLSVLRPLAVLVTPAMTAAVARGVLHLRSCPAIDQGRLLNVLNGFTAWAEIHQSHGGDLAGFFQYQEMQSAAASEESPNRIRTQIRRGGNPPGEETIDPMLKAALFLCLAHTFDRQQDDLRGDLGAVAAMEADFGRIIGESPVKAVSFSVAPGPSVDAGPADRGLHNTAARIQAWAGISMAADAVDGLYLTDSRAVWEHLLEMLPETVHLGRWPGLPIIAGDGPDPTSEADRITRLFAELNRADDPCQVTLVAPDETSRPLSGAAFTLCALVGRAPRATLMHLRGSAFPRGAAPPAAASPTGNTLIGFAEL